MFSAKHTTIGNKCKELLLLPVITSKSDACLNNIIWLFTFLYSNNYPTSPYSGQSWAFNSCKSIWKIKTPWFIIKSVSFYFTFTFFCRVFICYIHNMMGFFLNKFPWLHLQENTRYNFVISKHYTAIHGVQNFPEYFAINIWNYERI